MNTSLILKRIAISSLFAVLLSGQSAVYAQGAEVEPATNFQTMMNTLTDKFEVPVERTNPQNRDGAIVSHGTDALQEKVLMQINSGLVNGWLSIDEASRYKTQLNKLNEKETWYKSMRTEIPAALVESNTRALDEMSQNLTPKTSSLIGSAENSLHGDIDELISNALAHKRISSSAAEKYYLRLAQIESNMESNKTNPAGGRENLVLNSSLKELKTELIHI